MGAEQRRYERKAEAETDARAKVAGVDVFFGSTNAAPNVFAIVIGDAAVIVRAGQVEEVVTRRAYSRGGFKDHDIHSHSRLFGGSHTERRP